MPELYVESRAGGREVPGLRTRCKYTKRTVPAAGVWHTVGLKSDGTVIAAGNSDRGQCDVSDWTDIVAVSVGYDHIVGLKADGTIVAAGGSSSGQCSVSDWTDIKLPGGGQMIPPGRI